jgi:hypothetical protein
VIEVNGTGEGDPLEFEVIVHVGDGETRHHVTMVRDTRERLRRFDVTVISRYFPEFEREPTRPILPALC